MRGILEDDDSRIKIDYATLNGSKFTPVQIQTVELVLPQKLDCVFNELASSLGARDQRREPRRSFVPTCLPKPPKKVIFKALYNRIMTTVLPPMASIVFNSLLYVFKPVNLAYPPEF